jgi:hypothetical protein
MITYCPRCGTRFSEIISGEWIGASLRCVECAVTVTGSPAMLAPGNTEEQVEYDLREWGVGERSSATFALLEVDIPYRWEADLVLVVPAVAEHEVDRLLDELEDVEELDDDALDSNGSVDGGEEAQGAMGDLFVAADRLQHDPTDHRMIADALEAGTTVADCVAPYGIERPVWRQIQALAAALMTDLDEAADEETVATSARALREYLRDLV